MAIQRAALNGSLLVFLLLVVVPLCCKADSILYSGDSLTSGQFLSWGNYKFIMQDDCNLELYDLDQPIWATNTGGLATNCYVTLRSNGNLVIYRSTGKVLWQSGIFRQGLNHYVLVLQKDRNVVIYGGGLWETHSSPRTGVSDAIVNNSTKVSEPVGPSMLVNN
ncbi:alpha-D-mannose-specific plant lectins domain-containing protein [Dioscorea alata]|uniref:Alpha-D-mannose-specific plant lectins domain-containing protein n=1 Tax=Dioscorea alata TaxID=55571 RepID=A0ACB7WNA3_DIOAL|nr:alpha-D-mannose-specific plant lectins domain-containing protein [Dioscorea alata]